MKTDTPSLDSLAANAASLQRAEPGSDACKAAQREYARAYRAAHHVSHKTVFLLGVVFSPTDGPRTQNYAIVTGSEVRVYDDVAQALTTCHALTDSQLRAIAEAADYSTINLNSVHNLTTP